MRIGLIAMSGVRAFDPELTALGLTLPGFVERNKIVASLPSLGLLTLAALTPPAFEVEYHEVFDLRAEPSLPDRFDLVAISSFTAQIGDAYAVARHYRALGATVVMGGLHVSALPDEALQHCSSVVVGEGEPMWPQLLEDFACGRLRRKYVQEPRGEYDLADSPVPRYELLNPERYNRLTVQTSRGCPHRCDFCASSILLTRRYKLKPVANVLREIDAIERIWPHPFIEFADDNSFVHRAHYKELLRALVGRSLRWFAEADVSVAGDDELLALMRDSGCKQVLIGFESPLARSLDGIELNANWKLRQRDEYLRAIEHIQSYGITVNGCFILGLDGDTPEVFDAVDDFVRESGLYEVQITRLTAFPGTPLYSRLEGEGRLIAPEAWDRCTLFDMNVVPKNMTLDQLREGSLSLGKRLYSDDRTRERRERFRGTLKSSTNVRRRSPAAHAASQKGAT